MEWKVVTTEKQEGVCMWEWHFQQTCSVPSGWDLKEEHLDQGLFWKMCWETVKMRLHNQVWEFVWKLKTKTTEGGNGGEKICFVHAGTDQVGIQWTRSQVTMDPVWNDTPHSLLPIPCFSLTHTHWGFIRYK